MCNRLDEIMSENINIPQTVGLKLPKLEKVDDKKVSLPDLNLPKLKKLTEEPV